MLLARTGRRVSEICLLDHDPLLPLGPSVTGTGSPGAFTARLRYQQTKIEGAPDTILVDEEIVAIIRAQQQWASRFLRRARRTRQPEIPVPGRAKMNRNGDRPYSGTPAAGPARTSWPAGWTSATAGRPGGLQPHPPVSAIPGPPAC